MDNNRPLETNEKPVIMITDVYEYENGSYGADVENRIGLWLDFSLTLQIKP